MNKRYLKREQKLALWRYYFTDKETGKPVVKFSQLKDSDFESMAKSFGGAVTLYKVALNNIFKPYKPRKELRIKK